MTRGGTEEEEEEGRAPSPAPSLAAARTLAEAARLLPASSCSPCRHDLTSLPEFSATATRALRSAWTFSEEQTAFRREMSRVVAGGRMWTTSATERSGRRAGAKASLQIAMMGRSSLPGPEDLFLDPALFLEKEEDEAAAGASSSSSRSLSDSPSSPSLLNVRGRSKTVCVGGGGRGGVLGGEEGAGEEGHGV